MAAQASPQEMNRFVKAVDEFFVNYAKLTSTAMRRDVYATGNPTLIDDYESSVSQGRALKATIEGTVGIWSAAKTAWSAVTGVTSTAIGDAIDEIRSWFGYQPAGGVGAYGAGYASPISAGQLGAYGAGYASPISAGQLGALGVIALPAAAWVAGIIGLVFLANQAMNKIFISVQATKMQRDDPTMTRADALDRASDTVKMSSIFGGGMALPLIAVALIAAYLLLGKKQ